MTPDEHPEPEPDLPIGPYRGLPRQTCETCLFRHEKQCRARPPQAFMVLAPTPLKNMVEPHIFGEFPTTSLDKWCREWESRRA